MGARESAQLRIGERGDDAMPGLSPCHGGRRDERNRGGRGGKEQPWFHHARDFADSESC